MFNWFKKRNSKPERGKPDAVELLVDQYAATGEFDKLLARLDSLTTETLSPAELTRWYQYRGVAAFRLGQRSTARQILEDGYGRFPDSADLAFSLAQEHDFIGNDKRMFELFDAALFPEVPASHALAQARYSYLWGNLDKAESYLLPLLSAYWDLRIADTTFLHIRGMPFFETTWATLAAIYELQGNLHKLEQLTLQAQKLLSDIELSKEAAMVTAVRTNDFHHLTQSPRSGDAYSRTQAASILAGSAPTPDEAQAFLEEVALTPDDFPWLADILLVAKCAVARRTGSDDQLGLQEKVLAQQPLLFEPEHAFNFRLLEEQEHLRRIYQEHRRENAV